MQEKNKIVTKWLYIMCFLIILMVFVGGLTRLTDSGLSMTSWKPITGILPPLNEESWNNEFAEYQKTPEYIKVNYGMSLGEFKSIYLLEFFHRILGRLIGIVYLVPCLLFIACSKIRGKDILVFVFAGLLFAAQGLMGWYMVKSGLVVEPNVSPYRLGAHLILAALLYIVLFWQLMHRSFELMLVPLGKKMCFIKVISFSAIIILLLQMFLGALVAGFKAGLIYNSFPLMGEQFVPDEIMNFTLKSFSNPVFIQFLHRINSYLLCSIILILILYAFCLKNSRYSKAIIFVLFAVVVQMVLGIYTLLYYVPISLALAHQVWAMILLSGLLWVYFLLKRA